MISIDLNKLKSLINETIEENPTILTLKQDVAELKKDVAQLKKDVAELKKDVAMLKEEVHHIKEHQLHLGVAIEEMQRDLKLILEAVIPAQQRALKVDNMVNQVNSHEYRLGAVESWIKQQRSQVRE